MSCNAKKDPNGTWRIQYRWTDWTGTKKKSQKRGFKTKKEAEEWYAHFMLQQSSDPTMTLADFWEIYKADMEKRLRKTTMKQKEYVMNDKVLPYFGKTPINEITAPMIRKWQGEMMDKGFKPTYLKTIHNQLSAILNYAVNFYDLRSNPCRKAGSMGKSKADERPYWTLEEFQKFSDAIMDKQDSWIAFQILFWTGMRIGELLALQVKDIDFDPKGQPYGKELSDAFVLVLDGKVSNGETGEVEEHCIYAGELEKTSREGNVTNGKILLEEVFYDGMKVAAEHIEESVAERIMDMQRAIMRQLTEELGEQALRTVSVEKTPYRESCEEETEQVPETDMSDEMMSMALAMGE